ncbi:MAG TPA: hypothetical protein VLA61_20915 [Ideonella sp.]|uniref:hypothetical protein n=1 Tax=Ideonella sp. TaxID=1929293 RepID=UPI002B98A384|nr:hypothetical protein [Ideonella sp.]HSI50739.1 hypothetical protein [Ideonella sp.]
MKLLRFNEPIRFGSDGNVRDYALSGWSLDEGNASLSWTQALEAKLEFTAQATTSPITLHLAGIPFLGNGKLSRQQVWVHLNGLYCGMFDAADNFDVTMPIRHSWLEPRHNVLVLTMPLSASPEQLELGADRRRLGVAMQSITLQLG